MDISSPYAEEALQVIDGRLEKVYDLFTGHDSIREWLRTMALALFEEARIQNFDDSDAVTFARLLNENAIDNFEANFTKVMEQIRSLDPTFSLDCKEGCWQCCHVHLTVMPYEAINIAREVLVQWSEERLGTLKEHCTMVAGRVEEHGVRKTVIDYFELCPFLENKACSTYSFRSLACRSWVSQDVEKCLASYRLRHKVEVPQNAMLMCQKEILYAAHAAYLEHKGLSSNLTGIFIALDALFTDFDGTVQRWFAGEKFPGEIV